MPHRIFTSTDEVAEYLHLNRADVERLVNRQDIPFEKRGERLVFRKVDLDTWATQRVLSLDGNRLTDYHQKSSRQTRALFPVDTIFAELTDPEYVEPALPAKTKASVLRQMASLAAATGRVADEKALLDSLEQREELCSTGVPGGLALLHPRRPDPYLFESPFVVLGRTRQRIPFGSPDGRSTDLFFLLACPDERLHLHTLARLCLMAQKTDLLENLRSLVTAQEMFDALLTAERAVLPQHV